MRNSALFVAALVAAASIAGTAYVTVTSEAFRALPTGPLPEAREEIIRQLELPAQPSVGDILMAFGAVIVRGRTRSCVDYGDLKTWVARVCYINASPPKGGGRPAIEGA